jgi:hypothetical protein
MEQIPILEKALEENGGIDFSPRGLGPWSYSKLKLGLKCPLNFYLKYILKVKTPSAPVEINTLVGRISHSILENVINGRSVTDSYVLAKKEYDGKISKEDWENYVDSLNYNISTFKENLDSFNRSNPVKRFFQELRIGVAEDWTPTGFFADDVFYRGVTDLGIELDNGDVIFIDHKTGADSSYGLKNYIEQLDTYKVLFHFGIMKIGGATAGIHFIRDGVIRLGDHSSREEIEEILKPRLLFYLEGLIQKFTGLNFFKHVAGSHCKYCDFAEECKSSKLKEIEKKTIRFFKK